MYNNLDFKLIKPGKPLSDFRESFWLLHNQSDSDKEIVVVPDGRVDLIFSQSATEPFHITLSGIETHPDQAMLTAKTLMFAISFKLLATEYVFHNTVSNLLNNAENFLLTFGILMQAICKTLTFFVKSPITFTKGT